ncbi:twin-arginine translocase TatA/TatE family subunit [Spirosoma daeguense]
MLGLGASEIVLIICVLLLFFGAKKLPELARGLGQGIREFKDATNDVKASIDEVSINK